MAAQGTGKLALFAWMTWIARALDPNGFGIYAFLTTVVAILGILSDFGLGMLATRAVARNPAQAGRYLAHTQLLRLILGIVAYALLLLLVLATPGYEGARLPALLFGISIFTLSGINGFNAILNGREEIHLSSLMSALVPLMTLAIGLVLFSGGADLVRAVIPTLIAGGLVLTAQGVLFRKKRIFFGERIERETLLDIFRQSTPLFIMSILTTLNVCLDTVLLRYMTDEATVGIYNASYKLVLALTILPVSLSEAAFPVWSRALRAAGSASELSLGVVLRLLLFVGLPISIAISITAAPLIRLLFGEPYLGSIPVLRIHAWTLLFMFINAPLSFRLVAAGKMRQLNITFASVVTINLAANLLLIPIYGAAGAAVATLGSEVVNLALLGHWVHRAG